MILIVGCAVVLGLIAVLMLLGGPKRPMPAELDGDWWPQFEREFRSYAERTTRRASERGPRSPNPRNRPR